MATFYLLPPRACLEECVTELLGRLLPGLPLPAETWDALVGHFAAAAGWPDDIFLIPRDDLPDGEPIPAALAAGFGAEPGDRVVEVGVPRPGTTPVRAWVLRPGGVFAPAGA
jgi:hypothetical protein